MPWKMQIGCMKGQGRCAKSIDDGYLHDKMIVLFTFGQQTQASNGGR